MGVVYNVPNFRRFCCLSFVFIREEFPLIVPAHSAKEPNFSLDYLYFFFGFRLLAFRQSSPSFPLVELGVPSFPFFPPSSIGPDAPSTFLLCV